SRDVELAIVVCDDHRNRSFNPIDHVEGHWSRSWSALRVACTAWRLPTRIARIDAAVAARLSARTHLAAAAVGDVGRVRNRRAVTPRSCGDEPRDVGPLRRFDERSIHL